MGQTEDRAQDALRQSVRPLTGAPGDYDTILELIGDAHFVLLGEASHGTHEFYRERARITQRLIEEKGFVAVAVEADWPDAYRVNRYVRGIGEDRTAEEALSGFTRFPAWMWRNAVVQDFVAWLRNFNDGRPKAGFYGLDLYSLYTSIEAVIGYLDHVDPEAAGRARARYGCLEEFAPEPQRYGFATGMGGSEPCEDEAVAQLVELHRRASDYAGRNGDRAADEYFYAEQNARLVKNAEEYYRAMYRGRQSTWNLRDRHMADTLHALAGHIEKQTGQEARIVVWAHNSHLGDARATERAEQGELNVGQLVRERYGQNAFLIGFSTYTGAVTAASDWDRPAEHKRVRPALSGSYEALLHDVGIPNFLLPLRGNDAAVKALDEPRLERAIGVIYRPDTERWSHYFYARLPAQFDAVLHFDRTSAVRPLEPGPGWSHEEPPETYPTGL